MEYIKDWFRRYFSDPQAVLLTALLAIVFGTIYLLGNMLAPVLAAIVIAYLLEGVVRILERRGARRLGVVFLVFLVFMAFLLFLFFAVGPMLWVQTAQLLGELPNYIAQGQDILRQLPQQHAFLSGEQVEEVIRLIRQELTSFGQRILSISLSWIPGVITLLVYLILVPLLVFFFLKDKERILAWITGFLPRERKLSTEVWSEVDQQIGNYVRGKFWEILMVGAVTFVTFVLLDLKYAALLAAMVGFSVLVPYIGAAVVTVPVAVVAFFQFGWSSEFAWVMVAYGIIQALDGNVLVPLLFSEVVNLHPVAIIVAVLVFGGVWGFWGVFFAIPLATLVNALIRAWPRPADEHKSAEGEQPA